jgi:protein TonB
MFKMFLPLILLVICQLTISQEKIYFDVDGNKTKDPQLASIYRITTADSSSTPLRKNEKTYNMDDQLIYEKNFVEVASENNKPKLLLDGLSKTWDKTGYLKSEIDYLNNKYHGNLVTYWPDGKLKRKDMYAEGKLISGICYDSIGSEIDHFPYEQMPQYPGGDQMLFKYLGTSVRYPVSAQKAGIQGRVIVQFNVDKEGRIVDLKVVRSVQSDLDFEAVRVVKNMPDWIPGKVDGLPVKVRYTLPVNFKLQ